MDKRKISDFSSNLKGTCSYVDCEYGAWTEWSTSCGKGERARKLQPIKKSKQAESCDGLTQTCSAKPEVETRTEMCKYEYLSTSNISKFEKPSEEVQHLILILKSTNETESDTCFNQVPCMFYLRISYF